MTAAPKRVTGPVAHPESDRDLFVIKIFTSKFLEIYL